MRHVEISLAFVFRQILGMIALAFMLFCGSMTLVAWFLPIPKFYQVSMETRATEFFVFLALGLGSGFLARWCYGKRDSMNKPR
jgi:hypothetical protein